MVESEDSARHRIRRFWLVAARPAPNSGDRAAAPRRAPRSHRGGAESCKRKPGWHSRHLPKARLGRGETLCPRRMVCARPRRSHAATSPEMLAQLQRLALVVALPSISGRREYPAPRSCSSYNEAADDLPVLENERHLVAPSPPAPRARPDPARCGVAEAWVHEARVVHAKFPDQRIERHHLGGVRRAARARPPSRPGCRTDPDRGSAAWRRGRNRFPKVERRGTHLARRHRRGPCASWRDSRPAHPVALQIHRQRHTTPDVGRCRARDQPMARMQLRRTRVSLFHRRADAEADLAQH